MKKTIFSKMFAALLAIMMLLTISPVVFAELDSGIVIFPITKNNILPSTTIPFADGVSFYDLGQGTHFNFKASSNAAYYDESGQYEALVFNSNLNPATAEDVADVYFGIDFGQNIISQQVVSDPARAFLTFDFIDKNGGSAGSKLDLTQLYVGSLYEENNVLLPKSSPVSLSKYMSVVDATWQTFEFPLSDLGITSSSDDFHGIYFNFKNLKIPSTNYLTEALARAFNVAIVSSVGASSKASVTPAEGEVNLLKDSTVTVITNATSPTITENNETLKLLNGWSSGAITVNSTASASEGQIGFRIFPSANYFASALMQGVNIEDCSLYMKFRKDAANDYVDNIEMGLGNTYATSSYGNLPTVFKTIPLGDFGYAEASTTPSKPEWEFTLSVENILTNGNETRIVGKQNTSYAGMSPNTLVGSNINCFAVKVRFRTDVSVSKNLFYFSELKLITPPLTLQNTTPEGGNISWDPAPGDPLCYSVFKSDGTKLCDTTDTTVANTVTGTYSVYAYYGNSVYSNELEIEQPGIQASITEDSGNVIFNFGSGATQDAVAIIAEYSDSNYSKLLSVVAYPITQATGTPAVKTVEIPATANKLKAFIFSDVNSTLTPLAADLPLN